VDKVVEQALADEGWGKFKRAFSLLRAECMACHAKNDHSFIVLPEKKLSGCLALF
jgi:hypothetical protein